MEKIGYINKNNLNLANGLNSIDVLKNIEIQYGYRDIVEERRDVVQPICAGVVITKNNKILTINKNSKSTGKKSPEKDKTLLYIGGHLDIADISKSHLQTFANGMKREIEEEIGLKINENSVQTPILTYTPISEKSAKHFGIIFPIIVQKDFNTSFTDGKCKFIDMENVCTINNLESWSEIILKEIIYKSNFDKHV